MIKLIEGEVSNKNATVTFGELDHDAFAARDPEGHVEVTVDTEVEKGKPVKVVLHRESDATFKGTVAVDDKSGDVHVG